MSRCTAAAVPARSSLLAEADVISLYAPLTPATRHLGTWGPWPQSVLIAGHQGFFTLETLRAIAQISLENVTAFERGQRSGLGLYSCFAAWSAPFRGTLRLDA